MWPNKLCEIVVGKCRSRCIYGHLFWGGGGRGGGGGGRGGDRRVTDRFGPRNIMLAAYVAFYCA
jgi:hypothetical protein